MSGHRHPLFKPTPPPLHYIMLRGRDGCGKGVAYGLVYIGCWYGCTQGHVCLVDMWCLMYTGTHVSGGHGGAGCTHGHVCLVDTGCTQGHVCLVNMGCWAYTGRRVSGRHGVLGVHRDTCVWWTWGAGRTQGHVCPVNMGCWAYTGRRVSGRHGVLGVHRDTCVW